jgi:hypothetical protein
VPLKSENPNVIMQYNMIVKAILREIKVKNISISSFCEDMMLDIDEFLDSLDNIKANFGYYLEVLEALKNY